jgi:UDP-glucose 4-epimerase
MLAKCLILGHTGALGCALYDSLSQDFSCIQGLSTADLDLASDDAGNLLASYYDHDTVIIVCSFIKRQFGNDITSFDQNYKITKNIILALEKKRPKHLIYISSAAIYGEDIEDYAITENTCPHATSFYGAAKLTAETLLTNSCLAIGFDCLSLLRFPTIYGFTGKKSYDPAGFLWQASSNETIKLWGDGLEKREFVFFKDAVKIVKQTILDGVHESVNCVAGVSYSFYQALKNIQTILGKPISICSQARTKKKVDQCFDNKKFQLFYPDIIFTELETALNQLSCYINNERETECI